MIGRELEDYYPDTSLIPSHTEDYFVVRRMADNENVFDASFSVRRGDSGHNGTCQAGRTELTNLIFGIMPRQVVSLSGWQKVGHQRPTDAIRQDRICARNRRDYGLFLELSCAYNIVMNVADRELFPVTRSQSPQA